MGEEGVSKTKTKRGRIGRDKELMPFFTYRKLRPNDHDAGMVPPRPTARRQGLQQGLNGRKHVS